MERMATVTASRPVPRTWPLVLLMLAAVAFTLAFGARYFTLVDDPHFGTRMGTLRIHILAGALPLLLGPMQFMERLRLSRPAVHRATGRIYALCILVGGITGLLLAPFANGGIAGQTGFAGLAVAWLVTTGVAIAAIRGGRVRRHREWMLRSYVVTLAFVWVRLILGLSILAGLDLQAAFGVAAWASWVLPLAAVQLVLARRTPGLQRTTA